MVETVLENAYDIYKRLGEMTGRRVRINLNNGNVVEGTIKGIENDGLTLITETGNVIYEIKKINSIVPVALFKEQGDPLKTELNAQPLPNSQNETPEDKKVVLRETDKLIKAIVYGAETSAFETQSRNTFALAAGMVAAVPIMIMFAAVSGTGNVFFKTVCVILLAVSALYCAFSLGIANRQNSVKKNTLKRADRSGKIADGDYDELLVILCRANLNAANKNKIGFRIYAAILAVCMILLVISVRL
ncbi:MAG: hypothetical protein Q8873_01040 [Bacillota bacterium]|nr:hypothetical protein [Bacillota bacterium]